MKRIGLICLIVVTVGCDVAPFQDFGGVIESSASFTTVYYIHAGYVSDHADPSEEGSIAWYFATYGGHNTYKLSDDTIYYTRQTLHMPVNTTLTKADPSHWPVIAPSENFSPNSPSDPLIEMNNYTEIKWITVHGMQRAHTLVYAKGKTSLRVDGARLSDTKRDFPDGADPHLSLVVISESDRIWIENNLMRRAGHGNTPGSKSNGDNWLGAASAIHAPRNTNLIVKNNDIAHVLSAGVAFGGSVEVSISDNFIAYTGRNSSYGGPTGDGLTAYNNGLEDTDFNIYYIVGNTIRNYENHGIHVSGRGILIQENTIYNGNYNAIRLGVGRGDVIPYCTGEVTQGALVRWNSLAPGWIPGYQPLRIYEYVPGTVFVHDNECPAPTPCTSSDIYWGPTC